MKQSKDHPDRLHSFFWNDKFLTNSEACGLWEEMPGWQILFTDDKYWGDRHPRESYGARDLMQFP